MFLGIIGGLLAMTLTGVPSEAYIQGIQMDFDSYHITYSYIKTLVFAFVLATVPLSWILHERWCARCWKS